MAGPTTESINDDVKELRDDLHKVEVAIREDFHRVETRVTADIRELTVQVRGILTAVKLIAVLTLTSLAASIWWGATLTADLRNLDARTADRSKALDARLDKIEAATAKILEQTRPATK